jgi:cAMP-dependent protein kinase regulator
LNAEEFKIVVDAMEEKRFSAGQNIIQQGEDGYELFVVEEGTMSCFRLFPGNS